MYADIDLSEDTTTLYVRWEISPSAVEVRRLERLGGPLSVKIQTSHYVDEGGAFHEHVEIDVPIWPHAGRVNRGQAKFRDHDARRRFVENLVEGVQQDAAAFLDRGTLEQVPVEGHVIVRPERPSLRARPGAA